MPELPEVETVMRGLAPTMQGSTIVRVQLNRADLRFPFPENLKSAEGIKVQALGRRAKFLTIDLENEWVMVCHLGMSGSFRIEAEAALETMNAKIIGDYVHGKGKNPKHDHMIFHLLKGDQKMRVIYNDPRRFGYVQYLRRADFDQHASFMHLGPEPLGNALSADYLAQKFAGKSTPIKSALLDQRIIAGLGNIYVCEALWRAGIKPQRQANTLVAAKTQAPKRELTLLTDAVREVIAEAIDAGGSSLNDYVKADGSMGYFQHRFAVYDREAQACKREGCSGQIERVVQSGRSSFYCGTCQK